MEKSATSALDTMNKKLSAGSEDETIQEKPDTEDSGDSLIKDPEDDTTQKKPATGSEDKTIQEKLDTEHSKRSLLNDPEEETTQERPATGHRVIDPRLKEPEEERTQDESATELYWTAPMSTDIVCLNVGDQLFTTTKSTLNRYPSTALKSILKNCDREGKVFIDRDGRMFKYILGFLRTGELCLPDDFSDFDSLTREAKFYKLETLSLLVKEAKQGKLFVKYIEVLELQKRHNIVTILKGRKGDLKKPMKMFPKKFNDNQKNEENSSYLAIHFTDQNARLRLTEALSRDKWARVSSEGIQPNPQIITNNPDLELCYRDVWKKSHHAE